MIKGLEALKTIRHIHDMECEKDESINKDFDTIEKELKALEIIKKYNIRPSDFHYHTTYNIYLCNMSFAEKDEIMSEEEYDFLKEILA